MSLRFLVFYLENKSLPLKYNFNFVIDEISNINDKAQVVPITNWKCRLCQII